MHCQSDGCRRALRAFSSLLRRQLPGSVVSPAEPSPEPPPQVVWSSIKGACVRGSSPPPGPRLPFSSSFSLVSGGATLERLFLLPGAQCGRGGAGDGRLGRGGRRSGVLLSSLPASLPHPTPPARPSVRPSVRSFVRPPAGLFGGPLVARARERPFSGFRGEGARGPAARGPAALGPGRAGRARAEVVPGATCPARSLRVGGQRIADGGPDRAPPLPVVRRGVRDRPPRAHYYCYSSPFFQDELASFLFSAMEFCSVFLALQSQRNPRQQMPIRSV